LIHVSNVNYVNEWKKRVKKQSMVESLKRDSKEIGKSIKKLRKEEKRNDFKR